MYGNITIGMTEKLGTEKSRIEHVEVKMDQQLPCSCTLQLFNDFRKITAQIRPVKHTSTYGFDPFAGRIRKLRLSDTNVDQPVAGNRVLDKAGELGVTLAEQISHRIPVCVGIDFGR